MKRATTEDGEFRVQVECRRSSRLSPFFPSNPPDLGVVLEVGLPPIAEDVESIEELRPSVADLVGAPAVVDGPLSDGREGEEDLGSPVVADTPSDFVDSQARVEDFGNALVDGSGEAQDCGSALSVADAGEALISTMDSGEHLCNDLDMVSRSTVLVVSNDAALSDGRCVQKDLQNLVNPKLQPDSMDIGSVPIVGVPSTVSVIPLPGGLVHRAATLHGGSVHQPTSLLDGCGDGGSVSEEGRVLPVAREALRPQPTDGLQQPSLAPVEPASVVAGRGGLDGCSGGRSYAHVVRVDRRADVELSYLPPVDRGNTISMEESDGDICYTPDFM
ncbi:hypothetical protein Dimus_020735, partial [Dionaea muscipula]